MTRHGFLSVPGHRHCHPSRASPLFLGHSPFCFSFLCSPGLGLQGLAFAVLACFPPDWNGGFHLWRFSGESLSRLLRPVGSPSFKSPGCRATRSPWLLLYRAIASITFRLCAATAAAPVHHTLRQPCFPRKLQLRGCRRCLQLRILIRRSPLCRYPCSVSIFGLISF